MTTLKQDDPQTLISDQDIRNERYTARVKGLNGRTPIEALLDDLSSPEWIYNVRYDIDNHVEYLFFMHEKQRELLLANPDILLMDCTYRTNRYRLPLLHIVGCTNLQTFFSTGFCFLRQETEQDYYWAVSTFLHQSGAPKPRVFISDQEEALRSAVCQLLPSVPQLLCVWHINKNVQTKAQHVWRDADSNTPQEKEEIAQKWSDFMARWNGVVYAKTEAVFNIKWQKLLDDYCHQKGLCDYLQKNQYPIRHQWAAAWTSQHRHYGTITSSPIEGMHKVLKDYLKTSQGDLFTVVKRIKEMILSQYNKYRKSIADAKSTIKFAHKPQEMLYLPLGIHEIVTPPAIEHIRQ
jgi:MULE transposase domain